LGQTVQSFLDSKDGGRDGAFAGEWVPKKGDLLKGRFVIQCKFTAKADRALRLSDVAEEIDKARRLVQQGRCDCYLLLTNFGVSGIQAEKLETRFLSAGVKQFRSFGADWICRQIRESNRLRMLVPRVYGLGDLSQILDERAYTQAKALLASMREDLSRVVLTGAYDKAIRALDGHGFVLLLGEPACGKTTIAAMLAMAAIDQWKASTLKLETSQQITDRWNPDEPAQFFWVDDAFGVTQYELSLVLDWNRIFPKVKAIINNGSRVVLTSRDYIYKRAKEALKESAFPLMRESQVVIDVREITRTERRQILYNHLKLGSQPREFRSSVKPFLEGLALHERFIPESARRLGDPLFTRKLVVSREGLDDFVNRQEQLLCEVITGLDRHSQASLALIFMRNGALESPVILRQTESAALERLGSDLGETIRALNALENSLTVKVIEDGQALWKFKHPTVGDAYSVMVLNNPELMDVYIEGAPPEKLLSTITCGDVGLKGAVVVPRAVYQAVLRKLATYLDGRPTQAGTNLWRRRSDIYRFLAGRCDRGFLQEYLLHSPGTLERVSAPGLFLYAVSEVDLAMRLFEFGLLPETHRSKFIERVTQYTVDGEDGYALRNKQLRGMFTPSENERLLNRLRGELIPNLGHARSQWESNYDSDEDPESYMQPFEEVLSALEMQFAGEKEVLELVEAEGALTRQWVRRTAADLEERRDGREFREQEGGEDEGYDSEFRPSAEHLEERSIFDDVDA
jgi:energy-coupling factor transporter ATP-binding protein EcfA2